MMSSLKVLDLSHNRIGDKGACALAAMLVAEGAQSSLPLQELELEANLVRIREWSAMRGRRRAALAAERAVCCRRATWRTSARAFLLRQLQRFEGGRT